MKAVRSIKGLRHRCICRRWRKMRIQEAAGFPERKFRRLLTACLALECVIGLGRLDQNEMPFRLIHMDEEYQLEWVEWRTPDYTDIFGIRLDTEDMEVEFYHQIQQAQKESPAER